MTSQHLEEHFDHSNERNECDNTGEDAPEDIRTFPGDILDHKYN